MSKHIFTFLYLSFVFNFLGAQVTFIIDSLPDYTPPEDILYMAGDFQGWNPGDPAFALEKNEDDKWFITSDSVPEGTTIQFKFTRGSWATVEKGEFGEEIPNRTFTFGNGDTVSIIIYNWADYGGGNSTAAENVSIMDDEFYIPQLDRYRRIWIYLPPDYENSNLNYPVIYMHDGQNLFDTYTSFAGEWEVDETLNELFDEGYAVPIVVGIDNGGSARINEYTPWINLQYGGGEGSLYIDFIVETLKPFIDGNYNALSGRETTGIWGSSLGGLISHYGALKYPEVFSKAGIYSPSYWFSDSVWMFTQEMGYHQDMKLYQMTGDQEGGTMVPDTWAMHDTLTSLGYGDIEILTKINSGEHNEQLWREDFETAYLWLFHSYANDINENKLTYSLQIYPNPAESVININGTVQGNLNELLIFTMNGQQIYKETSFIGNIDVGHFSSGLYLVEMITDQAVYLGKFIKR